MYSRNAWGEKEKARITRKNEELFPIYKKSSIEVEKIVEKIQVTYF